MDKELIKIVKKLEGSLLGIGIENEKVLEEINKNSKIFNCFLLENIKKKGVNSKLRFKGKRKKVNIKKLKKKFKKKQMDTIICNYNYINKFTKHFVPSSIYTCQDKVYIYNVKKEEKEEIIKKYQRYTSDIKIKDNLIEINMQGTKNKFFKDKVYFIGDTLNNLLDLITNILIN